MIFKLWYDPGLRFTCTQCGRCCSGPPGYVWVTDAEAQAIADHLGLSLAMFHHRYVRQYNGRASLKDRLTPDGYDCIFLIRDSAGRGSCSIYKLRPQQCRTWPFWPENLTHERAWRQGAERCPGMAAGLEGRGTFVSVEEIRIIRDSHPKERG